MSKVEKRNPGKSESSVFKKGFKSSLSRTEIDIDAAVVAGVARRASMALKVHCDLYAFLTGCMDTAEYTWAETCRVLEKITERAVDKPKATHLCVKADRSTADKRAKELEAAISAFQQMVLKDGAAIVGMLHTLSAYQTQLESISAMALDYADVIGIHDADI